MKVALQSDGQTALTEIGAGYYVSNLMTNEVTIDIAKYSLRRSLVKVV